MNKQIIILVFVVFNYFNLYSQIIDCKHPKYEKINLDFENNCKNDTLERVYYFKNFNKKYYIANYYNNCNNVICYFNNKEIDISGINKTKFNKIDYIKIMLFPIYSNEYIGNISFDIFKNDKKIKTVKFFIKNYNYVFTLDRLNKSDTIVLLKEKKCLSNTFVLFPNIGTTTCLKLYNNNQTFLNKCFPVEEKILLNLSEIPKGIYHLDYFADFHKLNKTLIIK